MRKQFRDADRYDAALHLRRGSGPGDRLPAGRTPVDTQQRQQPYRLVSRQDDDGRQELTVYDPAAGRALFRWRGALACALLRATTLRPRPGQTTTARCGKDTVRTLLLEAARFAADTRSPTGAG